MWLSSNPFAVRVAYFVAAIGTTIALLYCAFYSRKLYRARKETVLIKRYGRISLRQIPYFTIFTLVMIYHFAYSSLEISLTSNKFIVNIASHIENILSDYCFYMIIWTSLWKFYMLYYDMRWLSASLNYRWHQIIRKNNKTNNNNNNHNNQNNNKDKKNKNGYQKRHSRTLTTTTIFSEKNNFQMSKFDPTWFISHKKTFGNYKYVKRYIYLMSIVSTAIITAVRFVFEDIYTEHGLAQSVAFLTVNLTVDLLPCLGLGWLHYNIKYQLRFEDSLFVGIELSKYFWCIMILWIMGLIAQSWNLGIVLTGNDANIDENPNSLIYLLLSIFYCIFCISEATIIIVLWLFTTKWVLKKIGPLLLLNNNNSNKINNNNNRKGFLTKKQLTFRGNYYNNSNNYNRMSITSTHSNVTNLQQIIVPMIEIETTTSDWQKQRQKQREKQKLKKLIKIQQNANGINSGGGNNMNDKYNNMYSNINNNNNDNNNNNNSMHKKVQSMYLAHYDKNVKRKSSGNVSNLSKIEIESINNIKLNQVLSQEKSLNLLMQHLAKEFSMECLLSLIEFLQWQEYILSKYDWFVPEMNNISIKYEIVLPQSIPRSEIIFDNYDSDKMKAYKLFQKYVAVGSQYEINISSQTRVELIRKMGNLQEWLRNDNIDDLYLFSLFNKCCVEMIRLLNGSFARFKQTTYVKKLYNLGLFNSPVIHSLRYPINMHSLQQQQQENVNVNVNGNVNNKIINKEMKKKRAIQRAKSAKLLRPYKTGKLPPLPDKNNNNNNNNSNVITLNTIEGPTKGNKNKNRRGSKRTGKRKRKAKNNTSSYEIVLGDSGDDNINKRNNNNNNNNNVNLSQTYPNHVRISNDSGIEHSYDTMNSFYQSSFNTNNTVIRRDTPNEDFYRQQQQQQQQQFVDSNNPIVTPVEKHASFFSNEHYMQVPQRAYV